MPAPLYAHPLFQKLTGGAWRPGGVELTRHGLYLCGFTPGMRVADVGCGAGATLELLRAHGLHALGLDIAPSVPQSAGADALPSNTALICAHAASLPLATAKLDGLVCECVLSLMQDTEAVLSGFARVLRPGGVLLLSDLFVHDAGTDALAATDSRTAPYPRTAPTHCAASCMDGALPKYALERALTRSGFSLTHFEDHTALLKPLAAQLLWHGLSCACTGHGSTGHGSAGHGSTGPGSTGPGSTGRSNTDHSPRTGYGLWIARRI